MISKLLLLGTPGPPVYTLSNTIRKNIHVLTYTYSHIRQVSSQTLPQVNSIEIVIIGVKQSVRGRELFTFPFFYHVCPVDLIWYWVTERAVALCV